MFYHGKKVLVTGGTGFIGSHLVQKLLEQGALVRIPVHHRLPVAESTRVEVEMVKADLTKQEDCLSVMEGIDYVFHAAGATGGAGISPESQLEGITINLVLMTRTLQAAWRAGVERFLILSSSTVYPAFTRPVKEDEAWEAPPHSTYQGYGWMKRYLEKVAEFVSSSSTLKIAIVRPTAVYGRYDNFDTRTGHVIPALIVRALQKENPFVVWGTGDEVRDFLHISDLARASLLMLEKYAEGDAVNIGYGQVVTIKDVVQMVLKATGHDNAKVVFDSTKPTTIPFRMVDVSKAEKLLNFKPIIDLEEGIRDTVKWYLSTI